MKSEFRTQQRRRHSSQRRWQWQDRDGNLSLRHILRGGGFASRKSIFRFALFTLAFIAILPPLYFHFKLRRFNQMQLKRCSWLNNPPLVCAHGGDSSTAFPNTMAAYQIALHSQVDCIEIDVSRSSDGVLFALHDRETGLVEPAWQQGTMQAEKRRRKTSREALDSQLKSQSNPPMSC